MDDLFSKIGQMVEAGSNHIIAVHNAVVDVVYPLPFAWEDFKRKGDDFETRFKGKKFERIGGGGINFSLVASSLGAEGVIFVGFMDHEAHELVSRIMSESGIDFPMICRKTEKRRNTAIELTDRNLLLTDGSAGDFNSSELAAMVDKASPGPTDWIASLSFYDLTFPLLSKTKRFFLDSGYGYPRREEMLLSRLRENLKGQDFHDFMIAANENELTNMSDELGMENGNLFEKGRFVANKISNSTGVKVNLVLHTESFSTAFEPDGKSFWAVPSMDINVVRRTNAGDTFAGAFLAAYNATNDLMLSCFFANAATAKRLADDHLPNRSNMEQFLRSVRPKTAEYSGVHSLSIKELRALTPMPTASSVYTRASPGAARPALQIGK